MEEADDPLVKWFRDELLPELAEKGYFSERGENMKLTSFEADKVKIGVDSFASAPCFARIGLRTPGGALESRDVLVKFQNRDPVVRRQMKLVPQFRNEVAMYEVVLPEFGRFLRSRGVEPSSILDGFPECHFARHDEDRPEKSLLVLKDLRKSGYGPAESRIVLDASHCRVALERIARFHAISYAFKFGDPEGFEKSKNAFVPVWYDDDPSTREHCEKFKARCARRGIEHLRSKKDSEVPEKYLEKFGKLLDPLFDFLRSLHLPSEPLAVVCHGDFNRNNVLFKYEENGRGISDVKLFDFQTSLYGSPCLDLSFFIYMNTTLEFREKHLDELFRHYHSTLTATVSSVLKVPEAEIAERIPLESFEKEFARVAAHAYVTVAFFMPVMMSPDEGDFEEDLKTKTFEEMAEENCVRGGEAASERIAQVIVDFYRRKFYA